VEEYMENDLADNSDNEKCFFNVEQRAARKIKAQSNRRLGKVRGELSQVGSLRCCWSANSLCYPSSAATAIWCCCGSVI